MRLPLPVALAAVPVVAVFTAAAAAAQDVTPLVERAEAQRTEQCVLSVPPSFGTAREDARSTSAYWTNLQGYILNGGSNVGLPEGHPVMVATQAFWQAQLALDDYVYGTCPVGSQAGCLPAVRGHARHDELVAARDQAASGVQEVIAEQNRSSASPIMNHMEFIHGMHREWAGDCMQRALLRDVVEETCRTDGEGNPLCDAVAGAESGRQQINFFVDPTGFDFVLVDDVSGVLAEGGGLPWTAFQPLSRGGDGSVIGGTSQATGRWGNLVANTVVGMYAAERQSMPADQVQRIEALAGEAGVSIPTGRFIAWPTIQVGAALKSSYVGEDEYRIAVVSAGGEALIWQGQRQEGGVGIAGPITAEALRVLQAGGILTLSGVRSADGQALWSVEFPGSGQAENIQALVDYLGGTLQSDLERLAGGGRP